MRIEGFSGADFDPLSRILGSAWHARHGSHSFWQGADELCERLSNTDKGFVVRDDSGALVGAILLRSPREGDHNDTMRMHWLQQRTRLGAMAAALGINARADVAYLGFEKEFVDKAQDELGSEDVGIIELLILAPEAQGTGVGRKLFEMGVSWLRERGALTVRLLTDDECDWGFYEHMGMHRAMSRLMPEVEGSANTQDTDSSEDSDFYQYIYEL
ncbi:MAG: GNAT family N-acetyltransferase [Coriobacteriales bacterium]|nr:GNAT family N-acetyltransferase [Coriobacteriales bacterium]